MNTVDRSLRGAARSLPVVLFVVGPACSAMAVMDGGRSTAAWAGLGFVTVAFVLRAARKASLALPALLVALTCAWSVAAWTRSDYLRADSTGYYSYLRSSYFDHDLDFADEWSRWGLRELPRTATGLRYNQFTVGPALLWAPFFFAADAYVLVTNTLGLSSHSRDGFSRPYLASEALGTIVVGVLGCFCLIDLLRRRLRIWPAAVAVGATVFLSPVVFYLFVQPGMAHGICFGLTALGIWALDLTRRDRRVINWALLGAILGLLTATRLQAAAFALLIVPPALSGLKNRTLRPAWLLVAGLTALLAFAPQMIAWKLLYGSLIRIPAGPGMKAASLGQTFGWFDASSPRFVDVLISADHGLFTSSPGLVIAFGGLVLGLRRWRDLSAGGLVLLFAMAWVNGGRTLDWSGDDAFGARRFDVVMPFMAVGFAVILETCQRRPLLMPGLVLFAFASWNAGLIRLYRLSALGEATGVERIAAQQAHQLKALAQAGAERGAGRAGRALAYKALVGEYLYWNDHFGDNMAMVAPEHLAGGWSRPRNRSGPPMFRSAFYPQSCIKFALMGVPERGIPTVVTARAPEALPDQRLSMVVNNNIVSSDSAIGRDWTDVPVLLPASALLAGENLICLRFSEGLPGDEKRRVAADVFRIQLP